MHGKYPTCVLLLWPLPGHFKVWLEGKVETGEQKKKKEGSSLIVDCSENTLLGSRVGEITPSVALGSSQSVLRGHIWCRELNHITEALVLFRFIPCLENS